MKLSLKLIATFFVALMMSFNVFAAKNFYYNFMAILFHYEISIIDLLLIKFFINIYEENFSRNWLCLQTS